MNLPELFEERSAQPPASVLHHLRMTGVRQKVAARRRRRIVAGVVAALVAFVAVGLGGLNLAGFDRSLEPAGTVDGFPEYHQGHRLSTTTSAPLAEPLELTFVPGSPEPTLYWHCDPSDKPWWQAIFTGSGKRELYLVEVEFRVNGVHFMSFAGTFGCDRMEPIGDAEAEYWEERGVRVGEPATLTATLVEGPTDRHGEPVAVPAGATWGVAAGEPVPFEQYVFPPRLDPLPELAAPEYNDPIVVLRNDPDDPNQPVAAEFEWTGANVFTFQLGTQTPGRLTVLVDGVELDTVEVWDYHQWCTAEVLALRRAELLELGLRPDGPATVTVRPEHLTGDWYLRLNDGEGSYC